MKTRKILGGLAPYAVILFFLLLLLAGTVGPAEGASSLTLAPAEVAARGSFGQSVTSAFTMTNTTDATVAMSGSLGALITFNLGNAVSLDAAPSSITPPTANGNLRVESLLANDGMEPLVPSGVVALIDATGKLAAKSPIPAQRLLPGERLPFVVEVPARPAPGRYKAISTFSFEGRTVTTSTDFTLP